MDSLDFNSLAANFGHAGRGYVHGDFNFDGIVDSLDFNALAANFGQTGRTFVQGNFSYDTLGVVDSIDFNILAARFGTSLSGDLAKNVLPASASRATTTRSTSIFGNRKITDDRVADG